MSLTKGRDRLEKALPDLLCAVKHACRFTPGLSIFRRTSLNLLGSSAARALCSVPS